MQGESPKTRERVSVSRQNKIDEINEKYEASEMTIEEYTETDIDRRPIHRRDRRKLMDIINGRGKLKFFTRVELAEDWLKKNQDSIDVISCSESYMPNGKVDYILIAIVYRETTGKQASV